MPAPSVARTTATWTIPLAAVAVLLGLLTTAEKRVYVPYYDPVGILTVCDGITGKEVMAGKVYSDAECDDLGRRYVLSMATKMGRCIKQPLTYGEWIAWGHFTYNAGTAGFCQSKAVRLLNAGDHAGACRQMPRWRFARFNGVLRDCSIAPWNRKCGGIPKRRALEESMCLDALP